MHKRYNLPSVKTLRKIVGDSPEKARLLRKVLEARNGEDLNALGDNFPHTDAYIRACFNPPSVHVIQMEMADEVVGTYGVEYIPKGRNERSPAIEYLNTGDTYGLTLLFVDGRYRVGSWGDLVERGDYE
jgi:hypothetical protein